MIGAIRVSDDQLGVIIAIVVASCTGIAFLLRLTLGQRLDLIEGRLGSHDSDIKDIRADVGATRVSTARIEGYMAASNGGGDRLPATDLSTRIARGLPDDVVSQLPEATYELEDDGERLVDSPD